jgi:hypothetical protein
VRINSVVELILGWGGRTLEKSRSRSFKNIHLLDMADSIPFLVSTQFQESIFPPINRPKGLKYRHKGSNDISTFLVEDSFEDRLCRQIFVNVNLFPL